MGSWMPYVKFPYCYFIESVRAFIVQKAIQIFLNKNTKQYHDNWRVCWYISYKLVLKCVERAAYRIVHRYVIKAANNDL